MTTPAKTMNGSELKIRLGNLGISPASFADRLGVSSRSVVRWFDSDEPVSSRVAAEIEKLSAATMDEMRKIVNSIADEGVVTLRTFRTDKEFQNADGWPASWHRALVGRVIEHLENSGRTVEVVYQ